MTDPDRDKTCVALFLVLPLILTLGGSNTAQGKGKCAIFPDIPVPYRYVHLSFLFNFHALKFTISF